MLDAMETKDRNGDADGGDQGEAAAELADYVKAFAGLAEMAVYGDAARALIHVAIDALE